MVMLASYYGSSGGAHPMLVPNSGGRYAQPGEYVQQGVLNPASTTPPFNPASNSNPFSSAMAGTQKGGLQDYINYLTSQAGNALNGGLLGYIPQTIRAGNAGGVPVNAQAPGTTALQSAQLPSGSGFGSILGQLGSVYSPSTFANIPSQLQGFAQRPWMKG